MKLFYRKHHQKIIKQLSNLQSPSLSASKQEELKTKIMASISQIPQISETTTYTNRISLREWNMGFAHYALAALIIIIVSTGTAQAASFAQPGDVLYPAKLLGESLQLGITVRDEQRAELQTQIAERRLEESAQLWIYTVEIPADTNEKEIKQDISTGEPESNNSLKIEQNSGPRIQPARKLTEEQAKEQSEKAHERFKQALEALKETQNKLENKGNERAAQEVRSNIERLENKARESSHEEDENDDE